MNKTNVNKILFKVEKCNIFLRWLTQGIFNRPGNFDKLSDEMPTILICSELVVVNFKVNVSYSSIILACLPTSQATFPPSS